MPVKQTSPFNINITLSYDLNEQLCSEKRRWTKEQVSKRNKVGQDHGEPENHFYESNG